MSECILPIITGKLKEDLENLRDEYKYKILSLEDIYINLSVISKIEVNNKLIIDDIYITIDKTYFNFISRWFSNSSRDESIKYISYIINSSFIYLNHLTEVDRLNNHLQLCLNGLNNLKQTYISDKLMQAKIDVIIGNINI